jgi:hypothetical protein
VEKANFFEFYLFLDPRRTLSALSIKLLLFHTLLSALIIGSTSFSGSLSTNGSISRLAIAVRYISSTGSLLSKSLLIANPTASVTSQAARSFLFPVR